MFKHQELQRFGLKLNEFHQIGVVDRGSETQLQVGANLNYLI